MASFLGFISRNYETFVPATPPKKPRTLRFGILGAAKIAPRALIGPARNHPEVVVEAIAARDPERAKAFAKKHGIPKTYPSYQDLLDDPSIDVVYVPLPTGLHYEWALKSLRAGKHVLVEKPATNTRAEAEKLFSVAKEKGLILLEAYHILFHPAIQTLKQLVASGKIGKVTSIEAELAAPSVIPLGDIKKSYELGGGAMMELGGYTTGLARYVLGAEPIDTSDIQVEAFEEEQRVDRSMRVSYSFPSNVTTTIYGDLAMPSRFLVIPRMIQAWIKVDGTEGSVCLYNFIAPSLWHSIEVIEGKGDGAKKSYRKAYTFEGLDSNAKSDASWLTYRYQLEAFVDKVLGRTPQTWVTEEQTLGNLAALEMVYKNSGLGARPASTYE
ncbi:NAD(P)-binding protein [Clavulina sp. PMI_390]|nr:NAD(P)-binding protein [Clavulina sp. PMI_390]